MRRRTGKTTRIVDAMVQRLFEKGYIEMIVPNNTSEDDIRGKDKETLFSDGETQNENRLTFRIFIERLHTEHRISTVFKNLKIEGLKATLINQYK